MIPHGPIDSYLKQLGEGLRLPTWERARVLEEARDHLEQATTSFPCAAHDRTKAESRAVEAFGTVREVSDRFHLESTTLGKIEMIRILIKPAISAIMLFTFAFAVLYGGFNRLRAAGRTREGRFFDRDRHCYHVCERRSAVPPLDAQRKPASNRRGGVSRVSRSDGYWRMDRDRRTADGSQQRQLRVLPARMGIGVGCPGGDGGFFRICRRHSHACRFVTKLILKLEPR